MSPPPASIREELSDAIRSGIRRRGPDAVGLVLVGVAWLIVGTAAAGVLLAIGAISGYEVTTSQFAGLTGATALVNWLSAKRRSLR